MLRDTGNRPTAVVGGDTVRTWVGNAPWGYAGNDPSRPVANWYSISGESHRGSARVTEGRRTQRLDDPHRTSRDHTDGVVPPPLCWTRRWSGAARGHTQCLSGVAAGLLMSGQRRGQSDDLKAEREVMPGSRDASTC